MSLDVTVAVVLAVAVGFIGFNATIGTRQEIQLSSACGIFDYEHIFFISHFFTQGYHLKHRENCKTLPTEHSISCQGVKIFYLKDPFKLVFLLIN